MIRATLCLLVLLTLATTGRAQTAPSDIAGANAGTHTAAPPTFRIHWENDGSLLKRNNVTDRHYTSGAGLSLAYQPDWARELAPRVPFAEDFGPADYAAGFVVGQLIFTPENLVASPVLNDDRPYAGYLFAGAFWQRANAATLDHIQLDLGIVGPSSLAKDVQEFIHRNITGDDPNGWKNQLEDEPTAQLHLRKKWRFNLNPNSDISAGPVPTDGFAAQLIPAAELALGTVYRHVEGGAVFRAGINLPDDFGPVRLDDLADGVTFATTRRGFGMYGFVRATARAVEHNLFLEGNTWKDSHGVEEEPLVGELEAGVAMHYRRGHWTYGLVYSQVHTTEEFKTQEGSDGYGTLTVSLTGSF